MRRLFPTIAIFLLLLSYPNNAAAKQPYKNALKLTFLSWASGSTKISYERAFPGIRQSSELCASVIGAGYDKYHNDPSGFTIRYGHKFFFNGYRPEKPLTGFYLRPEAIYSHYRYTHSVCGERTLAQMGALLGTFGYQYCIGRFIADAWVGGGYAFGTPAETGYHHGFQLWKWLGCRNDNIALSFSIRLGICF